MQMRVRMKSNRSQGSAHDARRSFLARLSARSISAVIESDTFARARKPGSIKDVMMIKLRHWKYATTTTSAHRWEPTETNNALDDYDRGFSYKAERQMRWKASVGLLQSLKSMESREDRRTFFSFQRARRPTPETLTTLNRTPGISPLAFPRRPKPEIRTSSFSSR
jgi:hypothetical protein